MDNIVNDLKFDKIAENLLAAEGPVFTKDGTFFMVTPGVEKDNKPQGQVLKVDIDNKKVEVVCTPVIGGYGGLPAGCQCDKENNIWIADMRHGLLKLSGSNVLSQVSRIDSTNNTMQGCNDCIFDYTGCLWVTAPAGKIAPADFTMSMSEAFGSVYCYTDGKIIKVDSGFKFSNGIAVQHSGDNKPIKLIVAETGTKTLWGYDIIGPGKIENKQKWADIPGTHEGGPDGMDFDEEGNLLVANWGGSHIEVFSPTGQLTQRIKCPFAKISNVHFRPHSNELYITEHSNNAVWRTFWRCKGKQQFCEI